MRRTTPNPRIRVACAHCGIIRVTMAELTLRICVDDGSWSYCFRCPTCGLANAQETDAPAITPLLAVGAPVQPWHLPAELTEEHGTEPRLTLDDLLDLHLLLEGSDWYEVLRQHTETGA